VTPLPPQSIASTPLPDAILLACVPQMNAKPMAARDLFRSELFRRRRRYAEASGAPWWIVSTEYGLVAPDEVIAPHDTRITRLQTSARRQLGDRVATDLERELGTLAEKHLEIHAGAEFVRALGPALRDRGAHLTRPLEGLRIGKQLVWYRKRLGSMKPTPPITTHEE
jgi:hypothetical protein